MGSKPHNDEDAWVPQAGAIIAGRYRVERGIGSGGMGAVVSAVHLALGERVALKLLNPVHATTTGAIERFVREARAATRIKSEHVVRVTDVGATDSGVPFIAMELLEGEDLASLVSRGSLPLTLAVDCILHAAEALSEAHAAGVIHRDIKPSNLWMTQRGDGTPLLKVLDFGISKLAAVDEASSSITATQAVFGSPAYMSPEQIRSSKRVDHRTDVWALGVVLHELLTAHLPFEGESVAAILAGISADPPITLCSVRPDLPVEIERAILRCLEKDPNRRASLAELAERLAPLASSNGKISADRIPRIGSALSLSAPPPPPSSAPNAPSTLAMSATEPNLTTAHADAPSKIAQSIPRRLTLAGVSLAVVAALTFAGVSFSKSRRSHTASDGATGTSAMAVSESATAPAIPVTLPANATPPSSVKPPAQVPPPAQSTPPTTVAGAEKAASSTAAPRKGASPKPSPRAAKSAAPPRPSDTAAPPVVLPVVPKPPETPSSNLSEDRR